jgi:dephospho-CoA kinase
MVRMRYTGSGTNENIVKRGLIIVITGGIASGKSFVLRQFKILGFKTVSLDEIVADLYNKNNIVSKAIIENFPKCVKNGEIDKNLLSNLVLQDHMQ